MIELEIQALSLTREGLVIDVGRSIVASGFTLQRQRLAQDANGILLTMVVRGPARKRRALETALDANERLVSFEIAPFEDGPPKPHFAAARTYVHPLAAPLPAVPSAPAPVAMPSAEATPPVAVDASRSKPIFQAAPEMEVEAEPEFIFIRPPTPAPAPAPSPEPFVELMALGPDVDAVDQALARLASDYPQVFPRLLTLDGSVAPAAREASLLLAGQRTGTWVFGRDYASQAKLGLDEAIGRIGAPALRALAEIDYSAGQLHIRHSPLCIHDGRSGCAFFNGYLEGLLAPVVACRSLSIFNVCCRSYGADECVLAITEG
ncbi:hypothetical protein ISP15_07405 [Dyella jejuensis]|uniref:4-vinyl reductase 4VR domain-containing protein n=1 Tax=Dyella jejuensis TaxID=1432009 RepID=A0ABW8JH48_9GAMM